MEAERFIEFNRKYARKLFFKWFIAGAAISAILIILDPAIDFVDLIGGDPFVWLYLIPVALTTLLGAAVYSIAKKKGPVKVPCSVCGTIMNYNRILLYKNCDWVCHDCMDKATIGNTALRNEIIETYDVQMLKNRIEDMRKQSFEIRKKCNVCNHIFCYGVKEVRRNRELLAEAKSSMNSALASSIGGMAGAMSGRYVASAVNTGNAGSSNASAEAALNRIVDYNKCPHCGSTDLKILSAEEFEEEKKKANAPVQTSPAVSSADELKKFKELLDGGVITQEEFDAKKKELLGL